jgi:hypothetical protein
MNNSIRYILAVVAGIVVAFMLVPGIEAIGHVVYPPPPDFDYIDPEQVRILVDSMPVGAFLFVLAAWLVATFAGGLLACFIARSRPVLFTGIIGVFIFAASLANLMMIPHPAWFTALALVTIPLVAFGAGRIGSRWK